MAGGIDVPHRARLRSIAGAVCALGCACSPTPLPAPSTAADSQGAVAQPELPPDPAYADCGGRLPRGPDPVVEWKADPQPLLSLDLLADALRVEPIAAGPKAPVLAIGEVDEYYSLKSMGTSVVVPWADLPLALPPNELPDAVRDEWYLFAEHDLEARATQVEWRQANTAVGVCEHEGCEQLSCLLRARDARRRRSQAEKDKTLQLRDTLLESLGRLCSSEAFDHRATACLSEAWWMQATSWSSYTIAQAEQRAVAVSSSATASGWYARYLLARPLYEDCCVPARSKLIAPLLEIVDVPAPQGASRIAACMTQRGTAWAGDVPRAFRAELFVPKPEPPPPYP